MENKLQNLIAILEEEKAGLNNLIEQCLGESEYLPAHYHSQALDRVNRSLQTLHNFQDKYYDRKRLAEKFLSRLELLRSDSTDDMSDYLTHEINAQKAELHRLDVLSRQNKMEEKQLVLDQTLADLLDKKIRSFRLILNKSSDFFLEFGYYGKVLKVTLPAVKRHTKQWLLDEEKIQALNILGFEYRNNESRLVLKLTGNKDALTSKLKIILTKMIFGIFYSGEFENESYILIKAK